MERVIEACRRELGVDVTELRRINFIKPEQMPLRPLPARPTTRASSPGSWTLPSSVPTGRVPPPRKAEAATRGQYRGIGMCYYIESTMGDPTEHATVRFEQDGTVSVLVGTQTNGQGHDTAYAQVLHQRLGVPFEQIRIVQGDTDQIKAGGGTCGSRARSRPRGSRSTVRPMPVVEKGKAYAAQVFKAAAADITLPRRAIFRVAGTDKVIAIMDLAQKARTMPPCRAWRAAWTPAPPPSSRPGRVHCNRR